MDEKQFLKQENERLRELVGSWRRKAQGKKSRRQQTFREGFYSDGNTHFKVYMIDSIPGDLPIDFVIKELQQDFLREVYPYRLVSCNYSNKYDAWIVEVRTQHLDIDMKRYYDLLESERLLSNK